MAQGLLLFFSVAHFSMANFWSSNAATGFVNTSRFRCAIYANSSSILLSTFLRRKINFSWKMKTLLLWNIPGFLNKLQIFSKMANQVLVKFVIILKSADNFDT